MRLPSIKNINVKGKRILLRVDFNVPIEKGKVVDDFRIKRTLPTINFLKKKGAKIILISHLTDGRAKTLRPMANYLGVRFLADKDLDLVKNKTAVMKNREVVMMENIRIYKGEEKNDKRFAKKLAGLGDIYVNDAFSASHRKHASIVGVPKYLPSYVGFLFEEEFKNLRVAFKPSHPFLFILGGIKFSTKIGALEKFSAIADKIFIGGALANKFFRFKKYLNNPKIILPIDVKRKNGVILDCGPKTVEMLEKLINQSKFILWNGPLGSFEEKGFEKGTGAAARLISRSGAKSIIGGGDTISAVKKAGISLKRFSFVSTAGGAMLEFLAKGTLPGIEALKS